MNSVQRSQVTGVGIVTAKEKQYATLVERRKQCFRCQDVANPSTCSNGRFDSGNHIGAWSNWQGNLDADIMIVGQEWGGTGNYIDQFGRDKDDDPTNKNLVTLMNSIGRDVPSPSVQQGRSDRGRFFFTNGVLCLRKGVATSKKGEKNDISEKSFTTCGHTFLRSQIDLIKPRAVFVLGKLPWLGLMNAFGLSLKSSHKETVDAGSVQLTSESVAIPLFHCGARSTNMNRSLAEQKIDWHKARLVLEALDKELGPRFPHPTGA